MLVFQTGFIRSSRHLRILLSTELGGLLEVLETCQRLISRNLFESVRMLIESSRTLLLVLMTLLTALVEHLGVLVGVLVRFRR